ncbi:5159_t:CDS:2, partial [Entrophospora sp. SA101]
MSNNNPPGNNNKSLSSRRALTLILKLRLKSYGMGSGAYNNGRRGGLFN